jgi:putative aminopeptidase
MKMKSLDLDLDLLAVLSETPGLPGREALVANKIQQVLPSKWVAEIDQIGNLVCHNPAWESCGPKVMLMAHMDEVGLIVRRILPDGFLQVQRLGGMGLRSLPGARLDLWTSDGGRVPAQAGTLPQHLDTPEYLALDSMYVDIGAESKQEAKEMGVQVGDGLTWASSFERFGENLVRGKAFDDRIGCFVMLALAHSLIKKNIMPACDLYLAFVVQEESRLTGGLPSVQKYAPQIVIGVDGTLPFDTPDLAGGQNDVRLGGGPALKWLEAIRGKMACTVPDLRLAQSVRSIAGKSGIPLQDEVIVGIGTALNPVPYANEGVRIVGLSLPVRYHHSPVEMADLRDVEWMISLLSTLIQQSL